MKLSDLKTGMILEMKTHKKDVSQYAMVLKGTDDGDIASGDTWFPLESDTGHNLFEGNKNLLRVYQPNSNMNYLGQYDHREGYLSWESRVETGCTMIWENKNEKEKSEINKEIEDLQSRLGDLKERLNKL